MALKHKIIAVFTLLFSVQQSASYGQEFDCNVEILTPQIQLTNKQIFETMEKAVNNFMNATRFTNDKFKMEEKINLSIVINLDKMEGQTVFEGSLQMVSSRPVFGTGYNTTLLRINDMDIKFEFKEFEPLQYIDGAFTSNLTSILAFYAYMCLGADYDSYSSLAGTNYYTKALNIANQAQTSGFPGWSATAKGRDNRYWLAFQMMDERFKPLRNTMFKYHRQGFDQFTENMETGRIAVLESLEDLLKVHKNQPNSFLLQVFLEAKRQEVIDLFGKANQTEKNRLLTLIETIDVANFSKYKEGLSS
ncbi:MAG: DUF4835 family protein [Bacteroidia bacterium]